MNYIKLHDKIIEKARVREKPVCYCERHHVLPKSMGGDDSKDNIVILTAREHFVIHWLLYKIHKNSSMALAFFSMSKPVGNGRVRYTSRNFKYAREAGAKAVSYLKSGEKHHMFGLLGDKNPHYGMKRSEKTKKLLSEKAKLRTGDKNVKSKKITCIETGEVFNTITEAKEKHKKGNINYALKSGGTAGGLHFSYLGVSQPVSHLKGYASGDRAWNSKKILNKTTGEVFETMASAGLSISVSSAAIAYAIKNKTKCRGMEFEKC